MKAFLLHSWFMTLRSVRAMSRQPLYIVLSLVQPAIWLLLFGGLFNRVVEIPGFAATSYVNFITPGVVVMTAWFSGGWSGFDIINEIDLGVLDRFLTSPANRGALIVGRLGYQAFATTIQVAIILTMGWLVGARYPGGAVGVGVLVACAALLVTALASISHATALLLRKEESVIAAVNFLTLPLTFLSSIFMQENLAPPWIQRVALFNPLDWAVQAGRMAVSGSSEWGAILQRMGLLLFLAILCAWLATLAFGVYRRSV